MAHRLVGTGTSIATSTTSAQSAAISVQSDTFRITATGANSFVAIGTNPTAAVTDYLILSGTTETLAVSPASQRVVGIVTGSTTIIQFPEGTGTPFSVGDYVTLTSVGQPYYNFSHQPVISVDTSSGYNGFFSTRISIGTNTTGIVTAFSSDGDLRKSVKVASRTDGSSGVVYIQQVQISGHA